MYTKFYQNQLAFVEGMTKTFWCVFYWFTVYQALQFFIQSETGVLYITVFKCSLHTLSVTKLR